MLPQKSPSPYQYKRKIVPTEEKIDALLPISLRLRRQDAIPSVRSWLVVLSSLTSKISRYIDLFKIFLSLELVNFLFYFFVDISRNIPDQVYPTDDD
jgi:hypothetical protein